MPPPRRKPSSPVLFLLLLVLPCSHPLSPPNSNPSSSSSASSSTALTRDLLGLDLGYSIAKEQLLRSSLGAGVGAVLERRMDFNYEDGEETYDYYEDRGAADYDGDIEYLDVEGREEGGSDERFFDEDAESLPLPLRLVRESSYEGEEDEFGDGGPSPVGFWIDPTFWGRRPGSGGRWGPFGGRPRRPPKRRPRPPPPRPQQHHEFDFGGFSHSPPPPRKHSRQPPHKKLFVGDQHQCSTGSCEFFLFCWLGGGIIEGGCGGFLFACCQRPRSVGTDVIVARVSPHVSNSPPSVRRRRRRERKKRQGSKDRGGEFAAKTTEKEGDGEACVKKPTET